MTTQEADKLFEAVRSLNSRDCRRLQQALERREIRKALEDPKKRAFYGIKETPTRARPDDQ